MRIIVFAIAALFIVSCVSKEPRFELVSSEDSGISFNNLVIENDTFNIMRNEYMYNGGGVGVGDLNNDGLQDLVFSGNKVSSRIYLNQGELRFKDITSNFEGLDNSQWMSGVSIVDINSDGFNDVYLTSTRIRDSVRRRNQLWINQGVSDQGEPHFKEMAAQYKIDDKGYSTHAAFLDYDLDGDLDLYVLNNIVNKEVPTNYRIKISNGSSVNNDHFYENLGDGTFKEVTLEAGIVYEGYGLGIAVGDVNKDGYPDLYISNDYIANDVLYINQRNKTFQNASEKYISYHSKFSMGNDMADMNNDGNLDIITLDMMPEHYFRKKQTINGNSYYFYVNNEKFGYQHQYMRNMLHMHNGFIDSVMLPFSEVGQIAGVYQTEWSWSPLFADYDNDGDKDLLITNGFPKDLTDKDFAHYKAQMHGSLLDDLQMTERIPVVKVSNYAFENEGDLKFTNQTQGWGMDIPSFSNGAVFADLDNDGDLDYVVNNINDQAFVYRNNTIGKLNDHTNYIRINLIGDGKNTGAVGAKVELWSNGIYQYAEKFLSRGYISSVDPVIHFGLSGTDKIDSLKVTWPNGRTITKLAGIKSNQLLTLKEANALAYAPVKRAPFKYSFHKDDSVINYQSEERDYIDFFQGQSIIQHKFSQISPRLAKGDLNGDGKEDILIGASYGQGTIAYLRFGSKFIPKEIPGLTGNKITDESDLLILDIDQDGDNDVIAISGGYAQEDELAYKHFIYRNIGGEFIKEEIPIPSFPASILRAADFDKDGDLDVFIGARVKKWGYPLSVNSYVLKNENGKLVDQKTAELSLGMVTDAIWSDFDSDGWDDLIITRELNSVVILKNSGGKSFVEISSKELSDKHGFWSGITSGDFDNDGDPDYIIGNLGRNHRFTISEKYPFRVYSIDLDKNGFVDPLATSYWKDQDGNMQEFPVNYLDELAFQSPFFRKMFTSYEKFSYTTIKSMINPDTIKSVNIYYANTTDSYVLWNDKGKLTWESLPNTLQTAPIKRMLVEDFNGDKFPDVLITGNDHSYDVSTGWYDSNKGTLLLGGGGKKFRVVESSKSGLFIQGQVESLLFIKDDEPYIAAGVNRGRLQVFRLSK